MDQPENLLINHSDASFTRQVEKLHLLTVYGRWLFAACLWLLISPFCLWDLRTEIILWQQYFTWVAFRYGLFFHPFSTFGLSFCIAVTLSVLVWQSRNILIGLPRQERENLVKQLCRIRQQGPSHPLWKWVQES
jgi:hypothetical protein